MVDENDRRNRKQGKSGRSMDELRRERLDARIAELRQQVAYIKDHGKGGDARDGIAQASASIDRADDARNTDEWQVAWGNCQQAHRFLLAAMSKEERESHRRALRQEAKEKLTNWRHEAVLDIIGREVDCAEIEPSALVTARFIMDEHLANRYFKLEATEIGLRVATRIMWWTIAVLVAISIVLGALVHFRIVQPLASAFFLFELEVTVIVLVSGAVGAMLSNTLSILGLFGGRIPAVLSEVGNWKVRLPLGGLSAVVVVSVLQSGLLPLEGGTAPAIYGWSVAAGFSDQLLNRMMQRVEEGAEK